MSDNHKSHNHVEDEDSAEIADELVRSNNEIAETLKKAEQIRADKLDAANAEVIRLSKEQFKSMKNWTRLNIIVSILTLTILLLFAVSFFQFAIIVKSGV